MKPSPRSVFSSVSEVVSQLISNRQFKPGTLAALCAVLAALLCFPATGESQTLEFDGTQRPVALGFYEPVGVAVDQHGNLFVADADTFDISEIMAVNGSIPTNPTVRVLFRDIWNPEAIAVDENGNVYFADYNDTNPPGGQTIREILAVNGVIPASPTVVPLASGFSDPQGLFVDTNGDVFVADSHFIKELVAVNGSLPPSPVILNLGSGFIAPRAVAVDALGNVYVSDSGVKEILAVNGSIPASPTIVTLAGNNYCPSGLSFDSQGNLYFSGGCTGAVYEILAVNGVIPSSPVIQKVSSGNGLSGISGIAVDSNENIYVGGVFSGTQIPQVYPSDFGPVSVGTTSGETPLLFTFDRPATVGAISVTMSGTEGQEFADAGTGTCKTNLLYGVYEICTVDVTFTPKTAGVRTGQVLLKDTSGNVLATGYVHGTGVAPLANFGIPSQKTAIANVPAASGVAIDGSGNIYVSSTSQNQVLKETLSGGSVIQSVIPTSSLNAPHGIAVDGAGNIYIADTGNNRVLKETPSATGFNETVVSSSAQAARGVAVDGNGVVYIIGATGLLEAASPYYESYNPSFITSGLIGGTGVSVDGNGNIFVVSSGAPGSIVEEMLSGSTYTPSSIPLPTGITPSGISIDAFGNLYVSYTDTDGVGQVLKETSTPGGFVQSAIPTTTLNQPSGIAVDPSGNIFIADTGNSRLVEEDYVDPPALNFASTPVGTTSADSPQSVTLANNGNAPLSFPIPASGNNPGIGAYFSLYSSGPNDCPLVDAGASAPGELAAGASCELPISLTPTAIGTVSSSLVLTDNNLNATAPNYATQTISLSGSATIGTPVITWPAPTPITYGVPLSSTQLDATASVPGTFVYSPAAGTVLYSGTPTLSVTFTPDDTADYAPVKQTVQLVVGPPVLAAMLTPAPGSTLSTSSTTFTWTSGSAGVTGYFLWIGTAPGTRNIANISGITAPSVTVNIPANGAAIYVRLFSVVNGHPGFYNDYTYTEAGTTTAAMLSPAPGSTLAFSPTTFTWTTGSSNVTGYYMWAGTAPGTHNVINAGLLSTPSLTASIPANGATLYVRLFSVVGGAPSFYNDYTYTEATTTTAAMLSPAPGSTLTSTMPTFTWTTGSSNVTGYYLWAGTAPGTHNVINAGLLSTPSLTASIPANGATLYVRLFSVVGGAPSYYNDYTFTEPQ